MDTPTGAEALVRMLDLYGVRYLFGLCGDTSLPYYDALARLDHGITHILTRDERSAAYMADGYARVTGRPGVCEGPSGGGATYLLPGLLEANESSVPVLGFTSDVPVTSRGKYPLTELDQQTLYAPLTKWNGTVQRADQLPHGVRSAFRAMTTGRPGAAHLCLPFDVLKQPVPEDELWAQPQHQQWPALRTAEQAALAMSHASAQDHDTAERLLRGVVGPDVPIATTLDLHANITEAMMRHATALVGYHTYPHIDMYETGVKAAR